MTITLTHLRSDLYQIIDKVIETQKPVEIIRKGRKLKIILAEKQSKLANIKTHPGTICGNPDDLVNMDWSESWQGEKDL